MIIAAVGMLREAKIVSGEGLIAIPGGGRADLLRQRLKAVAPGATGVISIGIGGALDPSFKVGDVVLADSVVAGSQGWTTDADWTARLAAALPHAHTGLVFGSDAMVTAAADKARLHAETGAVLADMESHVAARFAAERGLPLAVLRVVSDQASTDLPLAVTAGLKPDGGMNLMGVLASLARDPRQLPGLMRAGREAEAAFAVLSAAVRAAKLGT